MLKTFRITLFLAVFAHFSTLSYGATALAKPLVQPLSNFLTLTVTSPSSRVLNWELNGVGGVYTVSVVNLTTGNLEQQFNTSSTTATITRITAGNTYRYSVQKGADFIIYTDGNP